MPRVDGRVRVWGASGFYIFYGAVSAFYLGISLLLFIGGAVEKNGAAPLVTGIFMTAISLPSATAYFGRFGRPLTLDQGVLSIPKAFTRSELALSSVSGIGLVYRNVPRSAGWALEIWGPGEHDTPVRRFLVTTMKGVKRAPGVKRRLNGKTDWTIPLPHENGATLAASKPGRVAIELYSAVLKVQGLSGPLVTDARQKAVIYDPNASSPVIAWWSPDGAMGRAHGLPVPDPSKLADPSRYQPTFASSFPAVGSSTAPRPVDVGRPATNGLIAVPAPSPEVRRARRFNALITLATIPPIAALGVVYAVLLNRSGYARPGVFCDAVLTHSLTPTAACNVWRHHQIEDFIWWAIGLGIVIIAVITIQVHALHALKRASTSTDSASRATSIPSGG